MRVAAEAPAGADHAPYKLRDAASDLVGGAFHARRPVRRRGDEPLTWSWQGLLVALSGLASSLDIYLRDPFTAADMPAGWEGALPVMRIVGNPLLATLVSLGVWFFAAFGGWAVSLGRSGGLKRIAGGTALGFWSATLPSLAWIVAGLLIGLKSDTIAIGIAFLVTAHIVPSVAEACGVSIGRAFGLTFLFPLVFLLAVGLVLLGLGAVAKFAGLRLS